MRRALACFLFLGMCLVSVGAQTRTLPGYIRELPPESPQARDARHARVAARRAGTILIAHRGASTLATENTLEAYAAAMDYGADGCEVDVRRTTDGVLVLFHDDMLDRLTDGFGQVEDLSYPELLSLHPQIVLGTATARTRPPTFAALLFLARERAMLLHLDVKEPGLDDAVAAALDTADMWDHVVAANPETLPNFLKNPKLKLLRYKGGAYEDRRDVDRDAVRAVLAKPGQLLIIEDPRVAAWQLKRAPYQPVALPRAAFADWKFPAPIETRATTNLVPAAFLRQLEQRVHRDSTPALLELLRPDAPGWRKLPETDPALERRRNERILERAWAAERLGQLGAGTKAVIESLESIVENPSLSQDWRLNTLDARTAARALGRMRFVDAAPVIIEAIRRRDPDLAQVQNPMWTNNPIAWVDWRKTLLVPVLGELRCAASKQFLVEYVSTPEAVLREMTIPQFGEATQALLRQPLTRAELLRLLHSENSAVRGTVLLACLDHPTPDRTAALREAAPWALSLPRAQP